LDVESVIITDDGTEEQGAWFVVAAAFFKPA
jgi:hypothetical protein